VKFGTLVTLGLLFATCGPLAADTKGGGAVSGGFNISVNAGPAGKIAALVAPGLVVGLPNDVALTLGRYDQILGNQDDTSEFYGFCFYTLGGGPPKVGVFLVDVDVHLLLGFVSVRARLFDAAGSTSAPVFDGSGTLLNGGILIN